MINLTFLQKLTVGICVTILGLLIYTFPFVKTKPQTKPPQDNGKIVKVHISEIEFF